MGIDAGRGNGITWRMVRADCVMMGNSKMASIMVWVQNMNTKMENSG